MTDNETDKLKELCKLVDAHSALGWEVTLGGNGVNSSGARTTLYAVCNILGIEFEIADDEYVDKLAEEYL